MGRLFGTDGIRGKVNRYPLTAEMAVAVGRAMALFLREGDKPGSPTIVIGKDTRESGDMLESGLCSGLCAMDADVYLAGVFPTPGIAFLTVSMGADAGIVVSASHNPFTDNGIKIFNREGHKLSIRQEEDIEKLILSGKEISEKAGQGSCGRVHRLTDAIIHYADFLKKSVRGGATERSFPDGMKLVIDCANGAAGGIAEKIFPGAEILSASPNGKNINERCGSEHPGNLCRQVVAHGAAAGFAFDGDGDRVIAVDETGNVLSGDRILAICARYLKANQMLRNDIVVSTVMSNIGLTRALQQMGLSHVTTDVGDRHVLETMLSKGAVLGGEDSGHIIFSGPQTTGDGLLTALMVCKIMAQTRQPLSKLASVMTVYPQEMINVAVREKPDLRTIKNVQEAIAAAEASVGESGRVLVRYSGTQPLCRVMAEAATSAAAESAVRQIAEAIRLHIGE